MSKEKQEIVPELRFPEFTNDGEWNSKPLGEFADVSKLAGYEFTKHIVYESKGKIIALRGLNIKNNKLDLTDVKYIDNSELSKLGRSKLFIDDLMFTYIGTIGKVALIEENDRYYLAPNVSRIRLDKEKVSPNYILQYFNTTNFKKIEIAKYVSSSSQPALTMGNVRKFSINLPPRKQEQQKIANCLSSLDNLITSETEKLDLLKDHKKGLLQQLFPVDGETQPKFRFPEFKNDGDWESHNLGKICTYFNGGSNEKNVIDDGDYYLISLNSIDIEGNLKKEMKRISISDNSLIKNDLVMVLSDVAHGNFLGLCAIIPNEKYVLNQRMAGLRLKNKDVNIQFLRFFINNNQKYFKQTGQGSSQQNLAKSSVEKFPVLLPKDPNEQQKIANCLSSVDDFIESQTQKVKALKKHKKGLMQQLFANVNELAI